ncbi:hypothetical protein EV426DRAFT_713536 [Tirmania nivea]|nr:hypothetical protein EV426DRAFT_713536 [Tirmania nivea]
MAHQLHLQLTSSVTPSVNPSSHTQYPISSYPLEKYSFSVTHASETSFNSSQLQWTHYAHRDNLYFVIDTSVASGPARNTHLKVIWGTQVLEYLDFTVLSKQTLPASDSHNPPQPAVLSIAKVPCLAVRYPGGDGLTIRRFQVRFHMEAIFDTVKQRLESLNFPIQSQLNPPSRGRQNQPLGAPPQYTLQFPAPLANPPQFQGPPTNSYHHGSAATNIAPPKSQMTHTPQTPPQNPQVPLANNMPPPINYPSYPMQPPGTIPTFTYIPSPLPPPRQLPNFSSHPRPTSTGIGTQSAPSKVIPIEDLPPLRKPTPVTKAKRAPRGKVPAKAKEAKPSSSFSCLSIEEAPGVCWSTVPHQKPLGHIPLPPQLPDASPISGESGSANKERRPRLRPQVPTSDFVFRSSPPPLLSKQTHPAPAPPDESNKRVRFQVAASPEPVARAPLPTLSSASKGKGKSADNSNHNNIGTPSPPMGPMDPEASADGSAKHLEQERFRALENLIVDKIHNEDFCKLLCDVSRVWQRMGFEDVFKDGKSFDIDEEH